MNNSLRFTALALAAAALLASTQAQAGTITYHFDVNTSTLGVGASASSSPFYLDFQLNYGSGTGNSATIGNLTFTGGSLTGAPNLFGNASGDLGTAALLSADSVNAFNEIFQQFSPGTSLGFDVSLTSNSTDLTPDAFAFAILDKSTFQIPTTDPLGISLVQADIGTSGITIGSYAGVGDYDGVTVSVTPVPEASTSTLGLMAVSMVALGVFRARKSVKQAA